MRSKAAIAALGVLALVALDADASELIGGAPDTHVAVVRISSSAGACTGTYMAPGVVLTAAHCVPPGESSPGAVIVGFVDSTQQAPDVVLASHDVVRLDADDRGIALDLALVMVNRFHVPAEVVPLPLLRAKLALASADIGHAVLLVGFGASQPPFAAADERLGGESTLVGVNAEIATVSSTGEQARACFGDSGGPLLIDRGGGEYIAGVLSNGAADCSGVDHYVRVDDGRAAQLIDDATHEVTEGCNAGRGSGGGGVLLVLLVLLVLRALRRSR